MAESLSSGNSLDPGKEAGSEDLTLNPEAEQEQPYSLPMPAGFGEWKKMFGIGKRDLRDYPALTLAYIGDCVYELVVRTVLVRRSRNAVDRIHQTASTYSRASSQSAIVGYLEPFLTEEEHDVYRRGRNANTGTRAKNASVADYRRATGLEALIGYLYLKEDFDRMMWLIHTGISMFHKERKHE